MKKVNWIPDLLALQRIESLGLTYEVMFITRDEIDIKTSRANTARSSRLDKDHSDAISKSILKGDGIPMLVVRDLDIPKKMRYVIAGGNHRDEGLDRVGEIQRKCYVVKCSDAEFIILCRVLNSIVGKGSTKDDRIKHACDAVENELMSKKDAGHEFNVTNSQINDELRARKQDRWLASKGSLAQNLPTVKREAICRIRADAVFDKALEIATNKKVPGKDFAEAVKNANEMPSEAEAIACLQLFQNTFESKVSSPRRIAFLRGLAIIEKSIDEASKESLVTFLNNAGFNNEEIKELLPRCQRLASILSSR